jgi:CheY-like chemotaxis protein/GAF domain-containing protein
MATILVVDDNSPNRKLLVTLLSGDGHLTLEASDGLDGLRLARARQPQLIISDIVMPTMDGYGFVRALRLDPHLCLIPVIFYTAHYHEREAHKLAQACGVAHVVVKPSPAANLLKAVEQVLAGVCESDPDPLPDNFDREHLRLLTNKLTERAAALSAFRSRFEALAKFGLEGAGALDPHAYLEKACAAARNLFGTLYAVIAVTEKTGSGGLFFTTSGIDPGTGPPPAPALDSGPLGSIMSSRTPCRLSNPDGKPVVSGLPSGYPPAQSLLAVPLMTPTRAYGWICLADKIGADEFDAEDEALLSHMGTLAGRSYEGLALHLVLKRQSEKLSGNEDRARQLSDTWIKNVNRVYDLLGGTNLLILRARDRDELCKEACRLAIRQGRFRLAYIEILDSGSGAMRLVAAAGDAEDAVALARRLSTELTEQDDLLTMALRSQRPAICNELQDTHQFVRLRSEMLDRGYRAIAALPMGAGNVSVGRLVLLTEKPQFFDQAEMRLQTELAGHLALAIARRDKAAPAHRDAP